MTLRPMSALAVFFLFASAAHAGAAEALTAAINKCAAIADDATRHACYDQLPALVKSLAPVVAAEAPSPAATQPTTPPIAATQPTVPPIAASQPTALPIAAPPPTAPPSAATPPTASPPKEEKGTLAGLTDLFASDPVPADAITTTVASFTFDYGVFVVTLDNGQVWRQVAPTSDLIHLSRDKKDHVTVWRSSFGYYNLKIEGYHVIYHVKRIK